MKRRFIILIDFSPTAQAQVKLAQEWAAGVSTELLLVHHPDVVYPSMSDEQLREQLTSSEKLEALDRLREFAVNNIKSGIQVQYHVSEENLLLTVRELLNGHENNLVFVGLKGTGFLKRIFPGSTTTRLADEIKSTIVAVPKEIDISTPATLHVGVHPKYPLNQPEFDNLLQLLADKVERIVFLSIFANNEEKEQGLAYLQSLTIKYSPLKTTFVETYEGNDAFSELKQYMGRQTDGPLVLQRGARTLTDQLFRRFLINELVYDASVPLIILPA